MHRHFFQNTVDSLENVYKQVDWNCVKAVLIAFVITRAMVVVVTYFSMIQIPGLTGSGFWHYDPRNVIADGLIRWDSGYYIPIAQNGYTNLSFTAFFPLYPLLIRFVSLVTGNIHTSGLWVSNASFLIALFYLYAIAKQEFDANTAGRTVFYVAAAPAAFFFSTVYAESVLYLSIIACFYYARNGKWFLASLAGVFASATRLAGALVCIFIFLEALWQQGFRFFPKPWTLNGQIALLKNDIKSLTQAWKGILASIFSLSGLLAYMVYLNITFGDPFAFLHAETGWSRVVRWDWFIVLIQNIIKLHTVYGNIFSGQIGDYPELMDTFSIIVFIPLVIIVFLKFRPSFGWYTLLSFLMPLSSGVPISMRRLTLVLIPCYFLLAVWGKHTWVDRVIVGISLPLQALFLILFSHWAFAG